MDRFAVLWILFISACSVWFYKSVDLLQFGHCPCLGVDITVVQTLNISMQTFCVIGYQNQHRKRTFCPIQALNGSQDTDICVLLDIEWIAG